MLVTTQLCQHQQTGSTVYLKLVFYKHRQSGLSDKLCFRNDVHSDSILCYCVLVNQNVSTVPIRGSPRAHLLVVGVLRFLSQT